MLNNIKKLKKSCRATLNLFFLISDDEKKNLSMK